MDACSDNSKMAITLINLILSLQSTVDQRTILNHISARYGLKEQQNNPTVLTDYKVAELYGVHIVTVQDWLRTGKLKGFKEARKWFTRTDWLREFEDYKSSIISKK